MNEIFKKIDGFENYSVSDHGKVRNDKTGRILKPCKNHDGYLLICLMKENKKFSKLIHKLMAHAFLVNPENKNCIDHIDNDRQNNNLINLRVATNRQNSQNAKLSSKNTSGTKGVSWVDTRQRWRAQICVNRKIINLGYFINKDDAINIRNQRAKDEFGEFINKCELILNV